jgi:hypothetical protein
MFKKFLAMSLAKLWWLLLLWLLLWLWLWVCLFGVVIFELRVVSAWSWFLLCGYMLHGC